MADSAARIEIETGVRIGNPLRPLREHLLERLAETAAVD
jgi:hypothetical protein